jgi:hypothetical protein
MTCPYCHKELREIGAALLCSDQIHCAAFFPAHLPPTPFRWEES